MPARKSVRRGAKKSVRRGAKKSVRRGAKKSRVKLISDILSSKYGVQSDSKSDKPKKKKSTKKRSNKKKSTPKKGMKYKDFVKKEFPKVKKEMPSDTPFGDITKEVAKRWRERSNQ